MRLLLLLIVLLKGTTVVCADDARCHALILSGGRSKVLNYERYWNDCALLYSTLRHTCHLPQRNITLLMADGDNPAADMLLSGARGLVSSPTDLDGDGLPDLSLAATRQNLTQVFDNLAQRLTSDDHLFIFITDHGELATDGSARLWLWNQESIGATELAAMIGRVMAGTVNILLGTCYAGAFADCLQGEGRVVTAACGRDELSWACADLDYDEFVYHWICAVAQHDEQGRAVASDHDGDGYVSMQEAFDYARLHDRRPETPSLVAQPSALASQWSFGRPPVGSGIAGTASPSPPLRCYDLHGWWRLSAAPRMGIVIEGGRKRWCR